MSKNKGQVEEQLLPEDGGEEDRAGELEGQLADMEAKYLRAAADYQNYQRRAAANERDARTRGIRDVLESLLPVLDNADITLSQDADKLSAEQLVGGVRLLRDGLVQAMASHGVAPIAPEPGDEFVPGTHEAIMQTETDEVEPGTVAMTLQGGYAIGEQVVRPAKISVAKEPTEPAPTPEPEPEQEAE